MLPRCSTVLGMTSSLIFVPLNTLFPIHLIPSFKITLSRLGMSQANILLSKILSELGNRISVIFGALTLRKFPPIAFKELEFENVIDVKLSKLVIYKAPSILVTQSPNSNDVIADIGR